MIYDFQTEEERNINIQMRKRRKTIENCKFQIVVVVAQLTV